MTRVRWKIEPNDVGTAVLVALFVMQQGNSTTSAFEIIVDRSDVVGTNLRELIASNLEPALD